MFENPLFASGGWLACFSLQTHYGIACCRNNIFFLAAEQSIFLLQLSSDQSSFHRSGLLAFQFFIACFVISRLQLWYFLQYSSHLSAKLFTLYKKPHSLHLKYSFLDFIILAGIFLDRKSTRLNS